MCLPRVLQCSKCDRILHSLLNVKLNMPIINVRCAFFYLGNSNTCQSMGASSVVVTVVAGLHLKFTIVKMWGPNKRFHSKKIWWREYWTKNNFSIQNNTPLERGSGGHNALLHLMIAQTLASQIVFKDLVLFCKILIQQFTI